MSMQEDVSPAYAFETAGIPVDEGRPEALAHESRRSAVARADMYRFLAAVYLHPASRDLLRQLLAADFRRQLSILFSSEAVADIERFAADFDPDRDLETLRQEYMDLFAVPTARYVTPFEDVYRVGSEAGKPAGPLLGGSAVEVIRTYREAGAKLDSACTELPTHVGVELSFMSFLCDREAEALAAGRENRDGDQAATICAMARELQAEFLREHLSDWFPRLSRGIQTQTKSALYRGLALITEEFLAEDLGHLSTQPG